jgi:hypothetical protein
MEIVCICAIFSSAVAQQFVTSASLGSWSTSSLSSPRTALAATSLPNVGVAMFAGGEGELISLIFCLHFVIV